MGRFRNLFFFACLGWVVCLVIPFQLLRYARADVSSRAHSLKSTKFSGSLTAPSGDSASLYALIIEGTDGKVTKAAVKSNKKFTISNLHHPIRRGRLTAQKIPLGKAIKGIVSVTRNSASYGPAVLAIKKGSTLKSFTDARSSQLCSDGDAQAVLGANFKELLKGFNIIIDSSLGLGYAKNLPPKKDLNTQLIANVDSECVPLGARSTLGLGTSSNTARGHIGALLDSDGDRKSDDSDLDDDNDGISDTFDIDNDNDAILDNDDADSNDTSSTNTNKFVVFSNLHVEFDESINANATTLTKAQIDETLVERLGLAIQVVGDGKTDVELDCGNLPYCAKGGTGRALDPPPNGTEFPEGFDSDGDGKGTIEAGSSGDFQFGPGATSDEIHAGDVFIEESTSSGKTSRYAGMLNFYFITAPALKTVSGLSSGSYTVSYPVSQNDLGTDNNCFSVASSGDVIVTIEAWRPQRFGNTAAGESTYMDMGNLYITTNLAQAPCAKDPGNPDPDQCRNAGDGPGLCDESTYVSHDSNLIPANDALQDTLGDRPSSPSNTFTYSINLTACLAQANITWNAGETLKVPIQMLNGYGDNALQNFCFTRES